MGSEDRILEIFSSSNVKLNTNGMQSRNCLMLWNQKLLMQFLFSVHCFEKAFFVLILLHNNNSDDIVCLCLPGATR